MATLVHAGMLLAMPGREPQAKQTIAIDNGRVSAVTAGFTAPKADDTLIDLSDRFVLPGLIDCHVHLTGELGPHYKMDMVEEDPEAIALHAARHARVTLEAGFTTVRDLGEIGGAGKAIFALKAAVAKGYVPGPRIFAAGSIISPTGGHGITCGYRDDINLLLDASGRADGADGCRHAVRRQVSRGADFIKFVATGGVLTDTATGTGQQFFDDEYAAIVSTAHMLGRKTTAHAHGADGMKAALKAGVDGIEHGTFMDGEVMETMLKRGVFYVPTTLAGTTVAEYARTADFLPPAIRQKALESWAPYRRHAAQEPSGGVAHRLRHRHGGFAAWRECARIPADGSGRHDADAGDRGGDRHGGRTYRPVRQSRHARAGQGGRSHRRRQKPARRHQAIARRAL
ncbi:MAG TPA: amidohydrolase family protein, partial [Rhizomicrobium sp.]|nr:amidohydrolase family protein [Rhizomicrobium sp.]